MLRTISASLLESDIPSLFRAFGTALSGFAEKCILETHQTSNIRR
jgi:hypothetical protein